MEQLVGRYTPRNVLGGEQVGSDRNLDPEHRTAQTEILLEAACRVMGYNHARAYYGQTHEPQKSRSEAQTGKLGLFSHTLHTSHRESHTTNFAPRTAHRELHRAPHHAPLKLQLHTAHSTCLSP
jgi:hypothetical protein